MIDPGCLTGHQPQAPDADHAGAHDHGDGGHHHHGSAHRPAQRRAMLVCCAITAAAMIAEIVGGIWTNSLMLLSDALHMASHAAALGISTLALVFAARRASSRYTFGLYRIEVLAALLNGVTLIGFTALIGYQAVLRFVNPQPVLGGEMTLIALGGLAVNIVTAMILSRAGAEDLNTRSAFLHMLGDTLSSVAIVIGGIALWLWDLTWVDPAVSILVALVILRWSISLTRDSVGVLMERAPRGIDTDKLSAALTAAHPRVRGLHDVHCWEVTSHLVYVSAHVLVEPGSDDPHLLTHLDEAAHDMGIAHATWQLEPMSPRPAHGHAHGHAHG